MSFENLKNDVKAVIKTNGNQEVTGQLLQDTLISIIDKLGNYGTFAGVATMTTNPGIQDGFVFYFALEQGIYPNFGGADVKQGLSLLYNTLGGWAHEQVMTLAQDLGDSEKAALSQKAAKKLVDLEQFNTYKQYASIAFDDVVDFYRFATSISDIENNLTKLGRYTKFAAGDGLGKYSNSVVINIDGTVQNLRIRGLATDTLYIERSQGTLWTSEGNSPLKQITYRLTDGLGANENRILSQKAITDIVNSVKANIANLEKRSIRSLTVQKVSALPNEADRDVDKVYNVNGVLTANVINTDGTSSWVNVTDSQLSRYQLAKIMARLYSGGLSTEDKDGTMFVYTQNKNYESGKIPKSDVIVYNHETLDKNGYVIEESSTEELANGDVSHKLFIRRDLNGKTYKTQFKMGIGSDGKKFVRLTDDRLLTTSKNYTDSINEVFKSSQPEVFTDKIPNVIPTAIGKRGIDTKKRFYDAVGTSSLLDWEVTKPIGARGVEITNIQVPTGIKNMGLDDFTLEFWFKPTAHQNVYTNSYIKTNLPVYSEGSMFIYAYGVVMQGGLDNALHTATSVFADLRLKHHVITRSGDNMKWYVNSVLVAEVTQDHVIDFTDLDLQFSNTLISYKHKQFNFAATPEQIREWYNTGRVDRYELGKDYINEYDNTWKNYDLTNPLGSFGVITQIAGGIRIENPNRPLKALRILPQLSDIRYGKLVVNVRFKTDGDFCEINDYSYVRVGSGRVSCTPDIIQEKTIIANVYPQNQAGGYIYFGVNITGSTYLEIYELSYTWASCLHEYKGTNIQPHKLVDTGATPEDKFLNGATPTFEPEYQEHLSGLSAPKIIPQIELQQFIDTKNDAIYISKGTNSASDWKPIPTNKI